jgi:alpha/beta superfamily hydrolase
MVNIEKLFISNDNVKLEAEYFQSTRSNIPAVIICHPHPQIN